jgi:hypothetical protein
MYIDFWPLYFALGKPVAGISNNCKDFKILTVLTFILFENLYYFVTLALIRSKGAGVAIVPDYSVRLSFVGLRDTLFRRGVAGWRERALGRPLRGQAFAGRRDDCGNGYQRTGACG